ncbi:MAG: hypothetical protein JNL53_11370, partial [Cyclobacteriaceae bacterium]|nr:hypothetical protein [Cyclobacteriaceae bacterium]
NQANTYRPIGDDMYGSYYSRYGPGDGGALNDFAAPIVERLKWIQAQVAQGASFVGGRVFYSEWVPDGTFGGSYSEDNGKLVKLLPVYVEQRQYLNFDRQQQTQGSGPGDPTNPNNGLNWTDAAGGVINSFGLGTDITLYQISKGLTKASDVAKAGAKSFSTKLGVVGLAVSGYDIYDQGLNTSRTLDVVMGGVAFIPVVGWGISGTYFIGNLITIGITGQSIGDRIQGGITGQDGTKSWKPWGN